MGKSRRTYFDRHGKRRGYSINEYRTAAEERAGSEAAGGCLFGLLKLFFFVALASSFWNWATDPAGAVVNYAKAGYPQKLALLNLHMLINWPRFYFEYIYEVIRTDGLTRFPNLNLLLFWLTMLATAAPAWWIFSRTRAVVIWSVLLLPTLLALLMWFAIGIWWCISWPFAR